LPSFFPPPHSLLLSSIFLLYSRISDSITTILPPKLVCALLCSTFVHAQVVSYAVYTAPLTNANQQSYKNLVANIGACGSSPAIKGQINTTHGMLIMVTTASDQTVAEFEATGCGSALLSFTTKYTIPAEAQKTDLDLQNECIVNTVPTCGNIETTPASLCPCSPTQTGLYYTPITQQAALAGVTVGTSSVCGSITGGYTIAPAMNTDKGIVTMVSSPAGRTMFDFEQTNCGVELKKLFTRAEFNMEDVIQPIIDECWHVNHWHCGTAADTLCRCITPEKVVYHIPEAKLNDFEAARVTGGLCATPTRVTLFDVLTVEGGLMVYVITSNGRTQWDFEQTVCGGEIALKLKDTTYNKTQAEDIAKVCWSHGDHGHCGPDACPCPKPSSLIVTPIVFNVNITHAQPEGLIYMNNFFLKGLRSDTSCGFSRYLSTYADPKGFALRLYIDQFKTDSCTKAVIDNVILTSFRNYWLDAVVRHETNPDPSTDDDGDDHSGHDHFVVAVDAHAHETITVAGITSYVIEKSITLDVDSCWNASTDGLKCKAQNEKCDLFCALGEHCHTNDECGTGICGADPNSTDDDDDDHGHDHDHAHAVAKMLGGEYGVNIDEVNAVDVQAAFVMYAVQDSHDDHPDYTCLLDNASMGVNIMAAIVAVIMTVFVM
jgi:hypothetical protein